jgi:hypothetical protein
MMGTTVEFDLKGPAYGTALIAQDDSVWVVIEPKWWDVASWIWWWLCPSDRRASVTLHCHNSSGGVVRIHGRALRIARTHVRVRGTPGTIRDTMG